MTGANMRTLAGLALGFGLIALVHWLVAVP